MKSGLRHILSTFLFLPFLALLFNGCTVKTKDVAKMSWQGKTYQGQTLHGKPDGLGTLSNGDSIIYSGIWKNGLRQGKGWTLDSLGNRIDGVWNHDTLTSGVRRDSARARFMRAFGKREVAEALAFPVSIVFSE